MAKAITLSMCYVLFRVGRKAAVLLPQNRYGERPSRFRAKALLLKLTLDASVLDAIHPPPPFDCFAVGPTAFSTAVETDSGPCFAALVIFNLALRELAFLKSGWPDCAQSGITSAGALLRCPSNVLPRLFGRGRRAPLPIAGAMARQRCWGIFDTLGFALGRNLLSRLDAATQTGTLCFLRGRKNQLGRRGAAILPRLVLDEPASLILLDANLRLHP